MKRLLILIAMGLATAATCSQAQSLNAGQVQFTLDGNHVGTLSLPTGAGSGTYTWALPKASGTLLLDAAGGWSLLGNALTDNTSKLGSTNGYNVSLIANDQTRMLLSSSDSAVLLPARTELRLGDAAGGQYVALRSPTVVTPDSTTNGNLTFVFPRVAPGGPDVRIRVDTVIQSGNDRIVYLDYTNANTTGQIGFTGNGQETCNTSTANTVAVSGMSFTVESNAIYSFEAIVEVKNGADAEITWGTPTSDTDDTALDIIYRTFNLDSNGNPEAGGTEGNFIGLKNNATFILKGYMQTGTLASSPQTIQLRMKKENGSGTACITAKSAVQLITE